MVSEEFTPAGTVHTRFARLGAILRVKINNATLSSEKLVSLSVTGANDLVGDASIRLSDATLTGLTNGSTTVTATYAPANQFTIDSDNYVYLIVYPQTLAASSTLTISGETENTTFAKDIVLPEKIVLNPGHIVPLNVTLASFTPKDKVFFEERFTESTGTMGWSGSAGNGTFYADNTWSTNNSYGAGGSAKFGTGSKLGDATTPSISITPSLYQSQDIKLSFKAGAWNGGSESTTLKLSSTNSTLKSSGAIVSSVTLAKGDWTNYTLDVTSITGSITIKFEGNSKDNSRFLLDDVCVYYGTKPVEKVSPELSFAAAAATAVLGDVFTEPILTNTHSVPVTYSSSDEDVAEVASDGTITLKAVGSTTITASFAGNATYLEDDAEYSLTVVNPSLSASATTPLKAGTSDNSEVTFDVTANVAWTATKGTDSDDIIKSVSTVDNTVRVVFNENTDPREKTATVNITATNRALAFYDCAVIVTQNALIAYTITWQANGVTFTTNSAYAGLNLVLPASNPTKSGYVFRGWTLSDSVNSDGTGITYASAGDSVTGNVTYYAVFAEAEEVTNYVEDTMDASTATFSGSGYCSTTVSSDAGDWTGTTYKNNNGYIQINKNSNNYYLGSPTFSGDIRTISITLHDNTAASRTVYYCSSNKTAQPSSGDIGSVSYASAGGGTKSCSAAAGTRQFYVYSSGAVYIDSIVVEYASGTKTEYSNYTL